MRIYNINQRRIGVIELDKHIEKNYKADSFSLKKGSWVGNKPVLKGENSVKMIPAPLSMSKLVKLMETDEYHSACIDAISKNVIMKFECKNPQIMKWWKAAQFPKRTNGLKLLRQMVKYYSGCGNGLLIKSRNKKGEWVGFERLLPTELGIVEKYNSQTGFLEPDYIQARNNQKKYHKNSEIIHFMEETHRSEAWGLSSIPVVNNTEILAEIKKFDLNNFKNGLLIDYIFFVQGGSLRDEVIENEEGEPVEINGKPATIYDVMQENMRLAKGNDNSHSSIILESNDKDVKITVERLRQEVKDGSFQSLKKDLRSGIFAYHRVPPRVVSQLIAGQLGGDNNSDLTLFYENKIKPIQYDVAELLAYEFRTEYQTNVTAEDFDFGNLNDAFESEDMKIFNSNRNN